MQVFLSLVLMVISLITIIFKIFDYVSENLGKMCLIVNINKPLTDLIFIKQNIISNLFLLILGWILSEICEIQLTINKIFNNSGTKISKLQLDCIKLCKQQLMTMQWSEEYKTNATNWFVAAKWSQACAWE